MKGIMCARVSQVMYLAIREYQPIQSISTITYGTAENDLTPLTTGGPTSTEFYFVQVGREI